MSDSYGRIKVDEIVNSEGSTVDLLNLVTSVNGQTGAVTVSGQTDLSYTAGTRELESSTGNNVTLPLAVASTADGLLSAADKQKLDDLPEDKDYGLITNSPTSTSDYGALF